MDEFDQPRNFEDFFESITAPEDTQRWFQTPKTKMRERMNSKQYRAKVKAALDFVEMVREGYVDHGTIREAMTTADFAALTTNILSWKIAAYYQAYPTVQRAWAKSGRVQDFRAAKASVLDGLDQPFSPVAERGEYPEGGVSERDYGIKVAKFGKGFGLSFEATVNDFLGLFDELPQRLAAGARNTESLRTTQLYMAANGPVNQIVDALNQTRKIYDASYNNVATGVLNIPNLQAGIVAMNKQLSEAGLPVLSTPKYLEVPPDLEMVARQILSPGQLFATTVGRTDAAASAATTNVNTNVLAQKGIEVVVNPFLNYVGTTANGSSTFGQTSWFLWADPQFGNALEVASLAGHETPELWQKRSNAILVGGGEVPPGEGSFEDDTMRWRCRMFWGGTMTNPRFTYGSNGSTA